MTRNAVIVFVGIVLYVCSPARGIEASSTLDKYILDMIKEDKEVCASGRPFQNSKFAKICEEVKYPSPDTTLYLNNFEQFLCLGFYDRIVRLCSLDSRRIVSKSVLPNNISRFDMEIEKVMPRNQFDIWSFCQKWNHTNPAYMYPKTKPFALQLEKVLEKRKFCWVLCIDTNEKFIPLCSVLEAMDQMSNLINTELNEAVENQQGQSELPSLVTGSQSALQDPKIRKTASSKLPDNSRTDPDIWKSQQQGNRTELPQTTNLGTKVNLSVPAADLATTNAGNYVTKTKENLQEDDRTAKQLADVALQSKNNYISNNAKASNSPPPSIDLDEDTSDVTVISEHTQDEPEGQNADGDSMDSIGSFLPDDVDQNSLQPSEKREYNHRMPSIPIEDDSHFFGYFTVLGVMCIAGYVGYHHKQKILAMVLEGRRSRGGRNRRRPSTANYRKLDCTLEEAVTSQCNSNVTHVIY